MEAWKLIQKHKENQPQSHFFDHDTLKFFGERISEMYVFKNTEMIKDYSGNVHECYCLSSLQRKNPIRPTRVYHYFDVNTFEEVR